MTVMGPDPAGNAAHVHNEVSALHWRSHGNGATSKEISDALTIRRIHIKAEIVWTHLLDLVDAGAIVQADGNRTNAVVYKPVERGDL